jgi:hypothetical protein
LSGILAFDKHIKIPLISINELSMVFRYLLQDNPKIFYVDTFNQSRELFSRTSCFIPDYKYSISLNSEFKVFIEKELQEFHAVMNKSELEKELFVHDYCLNNFKYDYSFGQHCYTVLGPVLTKSAVCQGIALFVKMALDYLGVNSLVVSGKAKNPASDLSMEDHAWNIVLIDGRSYHLDVTFNMTIKNKSNRYDYFNLCDEEIKKDHIITDIVPACYTENNDYYSFNSMSVNSLAALGNYIGNSIMRGKLAITVKIKNVRASDDIVNKIMDIAMQQYTSIHKRGVSVNVAYNYSQMVFEIQFR